MVRDKKDGRVDDDASRSFVMPRESKHPNRPQKDAKGQFVRTDHGRDNSGVASAEPRVITGDEDATFDTDPKPGRAAPKGRRTKKPNSG